MVGGDNGDKQASCVNISHQLILLGQLILFIMTVENSLIFSKLTILF